MLNRPGMHVNNTCCMIWRHRTRDRYDACNEPCKQRQHPQVWCATNTYLRLCPECHFCWRSADVKVLPLCRLRFGLQASACRLQQENMCRCGRCSVSNRGLFRGPRETIQSVSGFCKFTCHFVGRATSLDISRHQLHSLRIKARMEALIAA